MILGKQNEIIAMHKVEIRRKIESIPSPGWRHRIDVGQGITTPGRENSLRDLKRLELDKDLTGLKVLDIGCSDGFFSFECESRGAEVTAIDNFCSTPNNEGLNGFTIAAGLRGSSARLIEMSVYDIDQLDIQFDVILFLNVLYHLRYPTLALDKIFSILKPGGKLLMKTYFHQDFRFKSIAFDIIKIPCGVFFESNELNDDPSNWWGFNRRCIEAMLRSAGFSSVKKTGKYCDRLYYSAMKPL